MFDCRLGKIVKTRGYKGEIVVETRFKNVEMFRSLKNVKIDEDIFVIEYFKNLQYRLGLKLKSIDNESFAKNFVGKNVFYSKDEVEFKNNLSLEDMINFELVDENNFVYGILDSIENYGAGNLLIVVKNKKEIILPENKNFIKGFDKEKQQIIVDSKLIKEVL